VDTPWLQYSMALELLSRYPCGLSDGRTSIEYYGELSVSQRAEKAPHKPAGVGHPRPPTPGVGVGAKRVRGSALMRPGATRGRGAPGPFTVIKG
jgi:hypothetical protein